MRPRPCRAAHHNIMLQVSGPPVRVTINLSILTMGPIEEDTQRFSLDCYFRQSWRDERLGYNATGVDALALNWAFLEKIWYAPIRSSRF